VFAQTSLLDDIKARGTLVCGVNNQVPGFGSVDSEGNFSGFDIDFCRALAAAVLGDSEAVDYRPVTAQQRPIALQTGEIDVLIRNTTWTSSRDTVWAANFAPITFYDGQGFMVRNDSGIETLLDFEGRSVCVQSGTTTELNMADTFAALNVQYSPIIFETADQAVAGYESGQCDSYTTDISGLVSRKTTLRDPAGSHVLDVAISKEPLGPAVRHGDDAWFDVVEWVVFGMFNAEEFGLTQANVEEAAATSPDPEIRRMLGVEGQALTELGLPQDAILQVIRQVGNYGEVYARNLGADTPFNIPRGWNNQYYEGGLIYGMPFR
jgi:general L-amino acid transport system substrate-binding protein